jgi:hypothetical protein
MSIIFFKEKNWHYSEIVLRKQYLPYLINVNLKKVYM